MDSPVHHPDILVSEYPTKQPSSERRIKHYSNFQQILLVGEGDFSFSSALANAFGSAKNMVPTSLDSREKVENSYESGKRNLQFLKRGGAMTLHGVDATTMDKLESIRETKFDRIVYNFPHAGFFGKEEDEKVIKKHRYLVEMFFKNASIMLSRIGEIHVTHKEFHPYNKWKLVEQAEKHGLVLKESVEFKKADYPGYTNRRGAGSQIGETFNLGKCRTYMFMQRESIATTVMLTKLSPEAHAPKSLETAILELESQLQARKGAETAKLNWDASLSHLKTLADKVIREKDEYRRQRDDALHQMKEAWRENESISNQLIISNQLTKALSLKDHAIKEKDVSLKKALLELQFERQSLKAVETSKADLEASFDHYKNEALHLNEALKKQKDDALNQMNEAWREKETISNQLSRALSLKNHEIKEKDVSLKKALLELQFERQALKAAETAKADLKASFDHYKNKALLLNEALKRQRDDALHQMIEAQRENETISNQLSLALSEKNHEIKEKDVSLKKALLELQFERQALRAAETAKTDLEVSFDHYINEALHLNETLRRQRDDALHKKNEAWREMENTSKQLTEAKDTSLKKVFLELEFKMQALKVAQTVKTDLEASFDYYMNEALHINEVCREREIIGKQLDGNSRWTWKSLAQFFS